MRLHARHGWAYDAQFWAPLAARLGPISADDRGYYGPSRPDPVRGTEPYLLIGHSLGAARMMEEAGPGCAGLVAINGFDRFVGGDGFPGIPARVVGHMQQRCREEPAEVAARFRERCADASPLPGPATARLAEDLGRLSDPRPADRPGVPLLILDGAEDPLLLPAHRGACFADVPRHDLPGGGHLLPLFHPDWCAEAITLFMATL
jgi:pimeloyl-[acyl-carrier protein] methyl ester esterase